MFVHMTCKYDCSVHESVTVSWENKKEDICVREYIKYSIHSQIFCCPSSTLFHYFYSRDNFRLFDIWCIVSGFNLHIAKSNSIISPICASRKNSIVLYFKKLWSRFYVRNILQINACVLWDLLSSITLHSYWFNFDDSFRYWLSIKLWSQCVSIR